MVEGWDLDRIDRLIDAIDIWQDGNCDRPVSIDALADAAPTLTTMALVKVPADSAEAKEIMTGAGDSEHMVRGQYNSWAVRTAINYATMRAISGAGYLSEH